MPNGPQNKPSSPKVKSLIEKLEADGPQGARWKAIMAAVDAVIADANVHNVSDSEKAELFFYIACKGIANGHC